LQINNEEFIDKLNTENHIHDSCINDIINIENDSYMINITNDKTIANNNNINIEKSDSLDKKLNSN